MLICIPHINSSPPQCSPWSQDKASATLEWDITFGGLLRVTGAATRFLNLLVYCRARYAVSLRPFGTIRLVLLTTKFSFVLVATYLQPCGRQLSTFWLVSSTFRSVSSTFRSLSSIFWSLSPTFWSLSSAPKGVNNTGRHIQHFGRYLQRLGRYLQHPKG